MASRASPYQLYALNRAGLLRLTEEPDELARISRDEADVAIKASMERAGKQVATHEDYLEARSSREAWARYRAAVAYKDA